MVKFANLWCQGWLFWLLLSAGSALAASDKPLQLAFLPDVHFHDVYGVLSDAHFNGPRLAGQAQVATIRTMSAQLGSTRLFNENYFAFIAALDDLARRQVKFVVLPGDFSDDGQPIHIRGLKQLLLRYQREHGMRFLLTFGNHDPVKPFSQPGGKADFMAANGAAIGIFSPGSSACPQSLTATKDLICSQALRELGYQELLAELGEFGLTPAATDLHWETPFSRQQSLSGNHDSQLEAADLANRQFEICRKDPAGTAHTATECAMLPDVSYLVEPVAGLWLLALDANVYLPNPQGSLQQAAGYRGSGNAGYNAVVRYKPYLLDWVKDVVARAKAQHKTLISFSHFPMAEFYQGQGPAMANLLGAAQGQLSRLPTDNTSQQLAGLGLQLHFGGHMHLNNTAIIRTATGQQLVNVQAPSIAAYRPAYKLLSLLAPQQIKVQTVPLDQVAGFDRFFPLYQREWQYLQQSGAQSLWDKRILQAKNYHQFANWHLTELTRQRFLPQDWPAELRALLLGLTGQQMLILSQTTSHWTLADLQQQPDLLTRLQHSKAWQQTELRLQTEATQADLSWPELAGWDGLTLATDFYRLQNAGRLALADIPAQRQQQYRFFVRKLHTQIPTAQRCEQQNEASHQPQQLPLQRYAQSSFCQLFGIIGQLLNQPATDDFWLDMTDGNLKWLQAPATAN